MFAFVIKAKITISFYISNNLSKALEYHIEKTAVDDRISVYI